MRPSDAADAVFLKTRGATLRTSGAFRHAQIAIVGNKLIGVFCGPNYRSKTIERSQITISPTLSAKVTVESSILFDRQIVGLQPLPSSAKYFYR